MSNRRAILLCAGQGTRARRVTDGHPKCLIQINGRTLISRVLSQLASNGVTDVHVIVGFEADQIAAEVDGRAILDHYKDFERTNDLWTLAPPTGASTWATTSRRPRPTETTSGSWSRERARPTRSPMPCSRRRLPDVA